MAREAPTVLVVDDDPAARRLVSIWLQERGFEVREAVDAESGLREAARLSPSIVLLDWRLPDQSGPTICRHLDEFVPRPAIVMLTGLDDPRDRDAARKAGADAYVVKGVDPDRLAKTLHGLLAGDERFSRSARDTEPSL
jgi:two-component system, OmpR family, phosphate regulon response regulator PhoB